MRFIVVYTTQKGTVIYMERCAFSQKICSILYIYAKKLFQIFKATAEAWTVRLNCNIRYNEVSAKTSYNVLMTFRNILELSNIVEIDAVSKVSLIKHFTATKRLF